MSSAAPPSEDAGRERTSADPLESRLREALAPHLQLVRSIGAGGMARVFLAREPALKRLVAVKVLSEALASDKESRIRFEREAQAVATLSHPNVVAIHTVGELSDGTPYFVMQYVNGRSLAARLEEEGPLPVAEGQRALAEVAAALAAAHQQGIIHRDIKAANILYEDATGRVLVSDFGIAASTKREDAPSVRLTSTGMMIGTPQYMSPEQMLAEPVTEKTDIYSVGLLAHELLAGSSPFRGSTPQELIAAHLRDVPAPLSERRAEVDAELDALIARCLEKDPTKRPTASEVAKRLAPGGAALLEWPPPGLEPLHGAARGVASMYWLGGASVALALVPLLSVPPRLGSIAASAQTLLVMCAVLGVIAHVEAMRRTWRVGGLAARALRGGYAWMTIAEVLADRTRDTGNVVSGSREYAGLPAATRNRLRRSRVAKESLYLGGGMSIAPLLLFVVVLGSSGWAPSSAIWLALALPIIAGIVAFFLEISESIRFGRGRRKKASAEIDAALSLPWYQSFETVRAGQELGSGKRGAPRLGRIGAAAVVALCVLVLLVLSPLMMVATLGPTIYPMHIAVFSDVQAKVEIADIMRPYALPKDDRITAIDAGRALYAFLGPDRRRAAFVEQPLQGWNRELWNTPHPADLFVGMSRDQVMGLPSTLRIIDASQRLNRREMAFLDSALRTADWKSLDVLARARRLDYFGAKYKLPFPEQAIIWGMPIGHFAVLKRMGYGTSSRAAYHLARGQRDSAELAIRTSLSAGLLVMDEGTLLIDRLIGAVMVGIGRYQLLEFFKMTNDPRRAALQSRIDETMDRIEARTSRGSLFKAIDFRDPVAIREAMLRIANDSTAPRADRFEMFALLSLSPCTNVHEFVFGPAPEVRQTFDGARRTWARSVGDTALLDLAARSADRLGSLTYSPVSLSRKDALLLAFARFGAVALGNRRLVGCPAALYEPPI